MKPRNTITFVLATALFAATPPIPSRAADLPQLVADVSKWESGQNPESLRQLEQLVRESANNLVQRVQIEHALIKLLTSASTFEARRYACQQLAIAGSDTSVPVLAKLLQDPETVGLACLAFGNRTSALADQALRDALPGARGQGRLQIIATLGNRRDVDAVPLLAGLARESDVAVAQTAILALGKIASEPARQAIVASSEAPKPALAGALADASLRCADELAQSGNRSAAAEMYEELLAPTYATYVRRGALAGLLRCSSDGGEQRIELVLQSGDGVLRPVAIVAIRDLPSKAASAKFGNQLTALTPPEQVWLIDSLAARKDASARSAVAATLASSADTEVRQAAAQALGQIGNASTVRPLAQALSSAKDDTEANALIAALAALPDERAVDKAMLKELKAARGKVRAQLVASLAARRSPKIITALLIEAGNPDPIVAKAAYRVLAKATTAKTLPPLLAKFAAIRDADLRESVEVYVEQAVSIVENPADRSAAVRRRLARVTDADTRLALLRLLPACGDDAALRALKDARTDPSPAVRAVTVAALAEWPDQTAWETLAYIYRNPENEAQHAAALRGLTRLFGERAAGASGSQVVAAAQELLDGAQTDADLKLILGALSGAKEAGVLKVILPLLNKPAVRAETEVAIRQIAEAVKATNPDAAQQALDRLKKP